MLVKNIMAIIMLLPSVVLAQDFRSFLRQVAENNPEIISYSKLLEARKAEARTNLYPPGPEASFGYMPGRSHSSDPKKTWAVSQRFDFPSRYLAMKNVSRQTVALAEQEFELGKLYILLDAQLTLYDYLSGKKLLTLLEKRSNDCSELLRLWKRKLDEGETTILEYNRIALELSSVNLRKRNTEAELELLGQKLKYLSGGRDSFPEEAEYPEEIIIPADLLIRIKYLSHPAFKIPVTEYQLSLGEVAVSRSSSLPELMAGYSAEILPIESFMGPVVGISIPLWSNAGKLKSAKARSLQAEAAMNAEIEKLKTEVLKDYSQMVSLKPALSELKRILQSSGSTSELNKALNTGEITITEYFSLLEIIYDTKEKLIETENEYFKSLAVLNDHLLPDMVK